MHYILPNEAKMQHVIFLSVIVLVAVDSGFDNDPLT